MRRLALLLLTLILAVGTHAQVGNGSIKGVVTESNGQPAMFFNVAIKLNGNLVTGTSTGEDGEFQVRQLSPGTYTVELSSIGYQTKVIQGVKVNGNATTVLRQEQLIVKATAIGLKPVDIIDAIREPFTLGPIDDDGFDGSELEKVPVRSTKDYISLLGNTHSKDDGSNTLSIGGMRPSANLVMFEGVKMSGLGNFPVSGMGSLSMYAGGIPARYGDVTGAVINLTVKNPSQKTTGSVEYLTSGVPVGNHYIGTDPYGYNLLEFSLSGPLLPQFRKPMKFEGKVIDSLSSPRIGYFLAGNIISQLDDRPSAVGAWKVRDEVLDQLKTNPLRQGFSENAVLPNTDFLRIDDFERVRVRPNTERRSANVLGKVMINLGDNSQVAFGGNINYSKGKGYDFDHSLFDFENYPDEVRNDVRVFGRFTQTFDPNANGRAPGEESSRDKSALRFQSASYNIQFDYTRESFGRQDPDFKDDLFQYGHIGKFKTYQSVDYVQGQDSLTGLFGNIQQTFVDTLITFEPGIANPELARYTQRYYELNGWEGFDAEGSPVFDPARRDAIANYNNIQSGGGLINGDNLDGLGRSVYGMWAYNGDRTNARGGNTDNYFQQVSDQFRLTGQGMLDLGLHNIVAGFEFEQRVERAYSINPRSLLTLARLRANSHIAQLDKTTAQIAYPGPYITYERLNAAPGPYTAADEQSFIDYNLRKATGMDPDGIEFLDVNALDPLVYQLEFFAADELYNGGNSLVTYFGYDPYGNRTRDRITFDDFFTATDEYGNPTRPVDAFRPNYVAGYIEDEFEFDDLYFNIGLRVDRYDANQQVLIDKYVLFPTVRAGEAEAQDLLPEGFERPSNIGDDYVVYVDNVKAPSNILGYRKDDIWYSADGEELADASSLRVANGLPAPLLRAKENVNSVNITSESFKNYDAQVNFMPRIAFSFPISDQAKFYAHYDVLTKRPTVGDRLDPSDYYFLESRASSAQLNNPNLRPERTIDYEIGFDQSLTTLSAIRLAAFYKESRDMIQAVRVFDAYPIEYRTFDNIDFSTVKGMKVTYDQLARKNMALRVTYTLQFAEGTGSNATSQLNLARSGEHNLRAPIRLNIDQRHQVVASLDYRYGEGGDYNGPIWKEKQVLKNTGLNLIMRGGSGDPYNPQANFTSAALYQNNPAPLQEGKINSASLPWRFRFDLRLDKSFTWKPGDDEKGKEYKVNAYLQIRNLFDARTVANVYRATGNPDDDGYLNSAVGKAFIESQNSEASFREYYAMKLMDPANWELPRRVQLGVRVNF